MRQTVAFYKLMICHRLLQAALADKFSSSSLVSLKYI